MVDLLMSGSYTSKTQNMHNVGVLRVSLPNEKHPLNENPNPYQNEIASIHSLAELNCVESVGVEQRNKDEENHDDDDDGDGVDVKSQGKK